MTQNDVTPSTPSTPSGTRGTDSSRTPSGYPPPLRGGVGGTGSERRAPILGSSDTPSGRGSKSTPETLPEATCAYAECQAGGAILAGAPRVEHYPDDPAFLMLKSEGVCHPGCESAYYRATTKGAA